MAIWRRSANGVNERSLPLNTFPFVSGVLRVFGQKDLVLTGDSKITVGIQNIS